MLTTVAIVVAVLIAAVVAVLVYASTRPDTFRVARSAVIAAPAETIYPHVADLRQHSAWSPFEKDPAMKRSFSGAESGPGQIYAWDGNREVGSGRIEVIETAAPSRAVMKLEMIRPFPAQNVVEFTLQPSGPSTVVTWAIRGPVPFMAKVMRTFIDCDKMCATMFDQGLSKLKTLAEA